MSIVSIDKTLLLTIFYIYFRYLCCFGFVICFVHILFYLFIYLLLFFIIIINIGFDNLGVDKQPQL